MCIIEGDRCSCQLISMTVLTKGSNLYILRLVAAWGFDSALHGLPTQELNVFWVSDTQYKEYIVNVLKSYILQKIPQFLTLNLDVQSQL